MKVLNWQAQGVKCSVYSCGVLITFFRESWYPLSIIILIILLTPILNEFLVYEWLQYKASTAQLNFLTIEF